MPKTPSKDSLRDWYKEYALKGDLHRDFIKEPKYTEEEKQRAINYYLEHGKCVSRTVKKLGYPCRPTLNKWILELASGEKKHCRQGGKTIKNTRNQKEQAVIALCSRNKPAKEVAAEHNITRGTLYGWRNQLLREERVSYMEKKRHPKPKDARPAEAEVSELRAEK